MRFGRRFEFEAIDLKIKFIIIIGYRFFQFTEKSFNYFPSSRFFLKFKLVTVKGATVGGEG